MGFLVAILVGMIVFIIYSIYQGKNFKKLLMIRLKEQWGAVPEQEYSAEMFESLKAYYLSIRDAQTDVDDITWNDLDMDDVFMLMNNTQTSIGEEYLYAFLRKPSFSDEELAERNRLMKFFADNEEKRLNVQSKLFPMGKQTVISVYEYINRLGEKEVKSNLPHYLMILGLLASVGIIFIYPPVGGILTLAMIVNNIIQYYKEKALIENYLMLVAYIYRLLDGTKAIYNMNIPEIKTYTDNLKKDSATFKAFQKGSSWVTPKNPSGDFFSAILDYVRMLTHIDLIKYNQLLQFFKNHRDTLNRIYTNIGFLDSIIAAASFRELLPFYCEPVLKHTPKHGTSTDDKLGISAKDLYHPLIGQPIANSISEDRSVLITGSNASGKSTFIKTLAINAILAQTIDTSTSRSYEASYFIIYSSMALRDNLFNKESYYMVEIKSLKRILNVINDDIPVLCFIDEVLRGTNTLERIAASSRILADIARKNALVFAATHDIELTQVLEKHYSNYHFQERIEDHEVLFDYKLYEGKAVSKNAIKLLDMLKFPKEITAAAEASAEEFLVSGEWGRIE
ncbi:MAG: hypothetical protein K0S04_153 [Herbinix sp.]|jgi:DNA mismatch repair ATPase MutS|nr:hypothetical protein [Herbinix sp.]